MKKFFKIFIISFFGLLLFGFITISLLLIYIIYAHKDLGLVVTTISIIVCILFYLIIYFLFYIFCKNSIYNIEIKDDSLIFKALFKKHILTKKTLCKVTEKYDSYILIYREEGKKIKKILFFYKNISLFPWRKIPIYKREELIDSLNSAKIEYKR